MVKFFKNSLLIILFFSPFSFSQGGFLEDIKVEPKFYDIKISWENKDLSEVESVVLLRKENQSFQSLNEGEEIYRGEGNRFVDKEVENEVKYYYCLEVMDSLGNISSFSCSQPVSPIDFWPYVGNLVVKNYILIVGPIVIIFLVWVDYFTRKRYEREIVEKMNLEE